MFTAADLFELDKRYLAKAPAVVSLREVFAGNKHERVIGLRHDIDNEPGAFECGLRIAEWEAARGYRSTYYLLHTAAYWKQPDFADGVRRLTALGHEVGIHNDALGEAMVTGDDAHDIFGHALGQLRAICTVRSTVAHGNRTLTAAGARNDEIWTEAGKQRAVLGAPNRWVCEGCRIEPRSLASYDLDFEALITLPRGLELTDSGGEGWHDFMKTLGHWRRGKGQLHINMHPDWWKKAL